MLSPPLEEGKSGLCVFIFGSVQFEIYLLCLIIPFSKMSGECSLETEIKKQKNMKRKLYFSL